MNLFLLFRKSLEPSRPIFPLYHPIALPRLGTPLTPLAPLFLPRFPLTSHPSPNTWVR